MYEKHCTEGVFEAGNGRSDFIDVDDRGDAMLMDAV